MWERGAKLQYTEPSPVNSAEHTVYWGNTLLKQVRCPSNRGATHWRAVKESADPRFTMSICMCSYTIAANLEQLHSMFKMHGKMSAHTELPTWCC